MQQNIGYQLFINQTTSLLNGDLGKQRVNEKNVNKPYFGDRIGNYNF